MDGPLTPRPASGAPLRVFLLGRFEVVREDTPIPHPAWRRRRPADLLKLVALAPGRALPRDQAIQALWPGKDAASGANNLHRALYDLRQILGGRWVDLEQGQVRLDAAAWVDVDAFEAAARAGGPGAEETAVALYRGDLSPEDPTSPWLADRRAALRALLAGAAFPLAHAAAVRGEAAVAVSLLRRTLEADPVRVEAHALLIRLLAEGGRRADALRQYDACEAALRARGLPAPGAELRALRDGLLRGELSPVARTPYDGHRRVARRLLGTPEPAPLRGRTGSLVLFESLVEQGAGALLLLGEAGVGTTRLAVEGARIAQARGAVVLAGACDPVRQTPGGVFDDLLEDYLRAGGAGAEPPPPAGLCHGGAGCAALADAIRERLVAIGGGRPIYLLVDDLHHADETTAHLLHELARGARALRLMLVATVREDAVHAGRPVQLLLGHLDCERLARGVRVQRLDLAAARAQLADVLGAPPPDALAAQLYRQSDGNPFYTEELARAFQESGVVRGGGSPADAVRARVARLGAPVVALLEAAAVAGQRFDLELVRPASGLGPAEALAALDQALEARLVDEDAAGYHFHHALARDALRAALPPARRIALHRAVADALEARAAAAPGGLEDAAEALAHHRREADQPDRAFGHLLVAGHRAAARAGLAEAHAFYEQALALADAADASGPRRLELLEALGQARLAQADLDGAAQALELCTALRDRAGWTPSPEQRARARRAAALAHAVAGRTDEAWAALETALADALLGAGDERAEVLQVMAQVAWHAGRPREALDAARRCAEEALRVGDALQAARGHDLGVLAARALGEPAPVEAPEPPEPSEAGPELPFDPHLPLWENDLLGDRPQRALLAEAAALRERAERRGAPAAAWSARAVEAALALRAGQLAAAEAGLREARAGLAAAGAPLGEAFALERLGEALTLRGRVAEGLDALGQGLLAAERGVLRRHALTRVHAGLARNRLAAGALYAAEDAAREGSALLARHGECAVCHALLRPVLVQVALARGRLREADREAADLEALAASRGGRGLAAAARLARAHVLLAGGAPLQAAEAFAGAADALEACGALVEAARARARAGAALRTPGAPEDRLREAEALEARAAAVLDAAGVAPEPLPGTR